MHSDESVCSCVFSIDAKGGHVPIPSFKKIIGKEKDLTLAPIHHIRELFMLTDLNDCKDRNPLYILGLSTIFFTFINTNETT